MVNMKKGYTLVEALVVMVILGLFLTATAKIMTAKIKKGMSVAAHGYYECYTWGGGLLQRLVEGSESVIPTIGCTFDPPNGAAIYTFYTFDGKDYCSSFSEVNVRRKLTISLNNPSEDELKKDKNMGLVTKFTNEEGSSFVVNSLTGGIGIDCDDLKYSLKNFHKSSRMYNSGSMRPGVLVEW